MEFFKKKRIFLDHASATPVLKEARLAMEKYFTDEFYNPSAIYAEGVKARRDLGAFREKVARHLHAGAKDIVFTSGGTESDNLAILGTFEKAAESVLLPHLVISELEHPAILEAAEEVKRRGGDYTIVRADEEGIIRPEKIEKAITKDTVLVSVSMAAGSIGVVQPISKIGRLIREARKKNNSSYPYFHTDATAAANYASLNVDALSVDLLTLDGAKMYAPKGSGVLVVRPGIELSPMIVGGGQERGLRAGTENLPSIAGFAAAFDVAVRDREKESLRLLALRNKLLAAVQNIKGSFVIGSPDNLLPNVLAVSFPGQISEFLAISLDQKGICVSAGAACQSQNDSTDDLALRFSLGRSTTEKDIENTITALKEIVMRA
ncbi:MAG: Cysteine desulfurase [Parcubacteria group bacterium]|nr:Cysteine desulfurase [Parcubacteria group bacterium]